MSKKPVAIALAAVLIGGGVYLWQNYGTEEVPPYRAWGTVDTRQVRLAFEGAGRIETLKKEEGERVAAGELLGTLDTAALEIELRSAAAQSASAKAQLQLAREGYRKEDIAAAEADAAAASRALNLARITENRQTKLLKTGGTTQQLLDNARSERAVLESRLKAAESTLAKLRAGLRPAEVDAAQAAYDGALAYEALIRYKIDTAAKLVTPVSGVLRSRLQEPGDMTSSAAAVYEIAVTDPKWVRAFVTETQLRYVKEGARAVVTTDTTPPMEASVGYISPQAQFTPKTVQTQDLRTLLVYEVRLNIADPDNALRLGQPVTVDFAAQ